MKLNGVKRIFFPHGLGFSLIASTVIAIVNKDKCLNLRVDI